MERVTLLREDWVMLARELELDGSEAPPGLRARIDALLAHVQPGWTQEGCTLQLDPAAARVVRAIVRRARAAAGQGYDRESADAVAEADWIVRNHQADAEDEDDR